LELGLAMNSDKDISRKDFVKTAAMTGLGLSMAPFSILKNRDKGKIRIGFIGVGGRGTSHVKGLAERADVTIPALCDIRKENAENAKRIVVSAGLEEPDLYTRGEKDYLRMLERDDLDGVIIAAPWLWHVPMAVATMKSGKYAAVEVPAATTLDGCWDLVEASESSGMPCMLMENSCYRPRVLAVLNMVRQGIFGELVHARCGYFHDLVSNDVLIDSKGNFGEGTGGESNWRTQHHINRNGDLYPTHGIGPVAHWLDINRGNRFETITSSATMARGLHEAIVERGGAGHPNASIDFQKGDVVTSTIKTANGQSIIVTHNTTLPRPKTMGYLCQGTKGIWQVLNDSFNEEESIPSIYIEDMSPNEHWEPFGPYLEKYESKLIKKHKKDAANAGHGGDDFYIRNAFVESVKRQVTPPIDVYDAAAWSAITPLSEESISKGGHPIEFPDFTDGKWMTNENIFRPEEGF